MLEWLIKKVVHMLFRKKNDDLYYPPMTLERFLKAQERDYEFALKEVKNGRKLTHWIWYIFPQMTGLGSSCYSKLYGIQHQAEAREYLAHPVLGKRLREITSELMEHSGKNADLIFGGLDAMKVRSCMTLFDYISPRDIFSEVLTVFYDGKRCERTLGMLRDGIDAVIEFAKSGWYLSDLHGLSHWQRVEQNGYLLSYECKDGKTSLREGINLKVVRCFAYLHDKCREDDGQDIEHGTRAAELVKSQRGTLLKNFSDEEIGLLEAACRLHTIEHKTGNPTINTCFDADRMDLGRCGIIPDPAQMATEIGALLVSSEEEYRKQVALVGDMF